MGIAYTSVADRIRNGLLLKIIMGIMILWLVSVRIMLETNGGPHGAVYPYFYLVYSAFRDVSTMHILLYINDFYDTRASKRALPLMLSAGIGGGTLAGFTANLLNQLVGLNNTPLAWAVVLTICFLVLLVIERRDFTYIDDIVEGVLRVLVLPPAAAPTSGAPYAIYNIGNHDAVELDEFIAILERLLGRNARRELLPMQPGDVEATYADTSRLRQANGFAPHTPLAAGLERFVAWYRDYHGVR